MARPQDPNSIRAQAARLSTSLGTVVTSAQVRYWKKKGYDLDDAEKLKRSLRNQQHVSKASSRDALRPASPELEEPQGLAYKLITDRMIDEAEGSIPMRELLRFLRDHWDAAEFDAVRRVRSGDGKTDSDIEDDARRQIAFDFWIIQDSLPSIDLWQGPDWVRDLAFNGMSVSESV